MPFNSHPYPKDWKMLAYRVKEAFNWRCALCRCAHGTGGAATQLTVHHIDGNRQNNLKENLIALCLSCHFKVDREAMFYFSCQGRQLEFFRGYNYLEAMQDLWLKGLQGELFELPGSPTPANLKGTVRSASRYEQLRLLEWENISG